MSELKTLYFVTTNKKNIAMLKIKDVHSIEMNKLDKYMESMGFRAASYKEYLSVRKSVREHNGKKVVKK